MSSLLSLFTERERDGVKDVYEGARGRKTAERESAAQKRESVSDLVCGFGGGPAELIFILKVEVSGLSDHNKHGQPGLWLWLR